MPQLAQQIEELFDHPPAKYEEEQHRLFQIFKDALNSGEVRAAQPDAKAPNGWRVNPWVKKGILARISAGDIWWRVGLIRRGSRS